MNINDWLSDTFLLDTGGGRLIFDVFGALVEIERETIRNRLIADLKLAELAGHLKGEVEHSMKKICSMLRVGRSAMYRYLGGDNYRNIG
ncbi:hypothetical protein BH23ACT11_BH23ACT11_18240 [soil metagenome]